VTCDDVAIPATLEGNGTVVGNRAKAILRVLIGTSLQRIIEQTVFSLTLARGKWTAAQRKPWANTRILQLAEVIPQHFFTANCVKSTVICGKKFLLQRQYQQKLKGRGRF